MEKEESGSLAEMLRKIIAGLPARVEGKWFNRQKVSLDGYEFVGCRFDGCTFNTASGTFVFDHCVVENCTVSFGSEGTKMLRFYNYFLPEEHRIWPQFHPTFHHEDGTVSIR